LDGFVADLPESVLLRHLKDPLAHPDEILGNATTRLLYDLFAFDRTRHAHQPQPAVTYSMVRETHVHDLAPGERTRIQHAFSYSDGFGREAQKKIQAEPGPIPGEDGRHAGPRWVGSGWTIFNNKGKPVRQFEPFFSKTHHFEFAAQVGVSTILVYDSIDRVVATLNPNHTFQKTVIDPWRQQTWDPNDTVLLDPRKDPDVGGFLRSVPAEELQPTWYQQRADGDLGRDEQEAAWKAAAHANTAGLAFPDALGRTVVSIDHNRTPGEPGPRDEFNVTRTEFDVQGNQLAVTDPLGRVIMTYDYDVAGHKIHQNSSDAGERWSIFEIAGKPLLAFDSRHHQLRHEYDKLRRVTAFSVRTGDGPEKLAERAEYGEGLPEPEAHNLRGKLYRQFDEAGVMTRHEYDFKGNLLKSSRQLLADYREEVDWAAAPQLEEEVFSSETSYDALNRPITLTAPDRSVVRPAYNEANLLERLDVSLKGAGEATAFVTNIDYNAKGQRELIEYGNGARTTSTYDPLTFRLSHLETTRSSDTAVLQDLSYSYDPAGNICSIADAAQQTIYFKNQVVKANGNYAYDAIYRLIKAEGREHTGNPEQPETTYNDIPRVHLPLPGDGQAMRNYRERYRYDAVGNILEILHSAAGEGGWRRHYEYGEIDSNNRLTKTKVGQTEEHYTYDAHGNMTRMLHLPSIVWNFKDQIASTRTQVVNGEGQAETAYYIYDSGGQRVRKINDVAGHRRAERIYLAAFEIYREYSTDQSTALEHTTLHIMDDKGRIALVESRGDEITIRYQLDNHLGSSCVELDQNAAVITYEEYYPYGSTSYQAGRSVAETSLKRYRFTGKEKDEETGFTYHGARYYAPWLGRWTSCDPAGMVDGTNIYMYVRDNPLLSVDSTGKQCDPTMQSCLVDPTAPTPREEELQKSLSEDERNLPPSGSYASFALAATVVRQTIGLAARPVDTSGNVLEGTYYLWSGDLNKAAAKSAIANEGGWLMSQTPQHVNAASEFADALHTEAAVRFPGKIFTDAELFDMAGKTLSLPTAQMRSIWDPPSAEVARLAVIGGLPVQQNLVSPPGSGTVQSRIEIPTVQRWGIGMSLIPLGTGALNIYGGANEQDSTLKALGIAGGSLEVGGSLLSMAGALRVSAPLMSVGSKASVVGSIITAPVVLSHAADDIRSDDPSRQLIGTLNAVGVAFPPAAFLGAYEEHFVKPAAETFYDIARRDISQMLGVPQSWVY
jgi:RHS repeat-associated protein